MVQSQKNLIWDEGRLKFKKGRLIKSEETEFLRANKLRVISENQYRKVYYYRAF